MSSCVKSLFYAGPDHGVWVRSWEYFWRMSWSLNTSANFVIGPGPVWTPEVNAVYLFPFVIFYQTLTRKKVKVELLQGVSYVAKLTSNRKVETAKKSTGFQYWNIDVNLMTCSKRTAGCNGSWNSLCSCSPHIADRYTYACHPLSWFLATLVNHSKIHRGCTMLRSLTSPWA